jgi:hypothetical protein
MFKLIAITITVAVLAFGGFYGCKASKVAMEKNVSNIEQLMDDIDNGK